MEREERRDQETVELAKRIVGDVRSLAREHVTLGSRTTSKRREKISRPPRVSCRPASPMRWTGAPGFVSNPVARSDSLSAPACSWE